MTSFTTPGQPISAEMVASYWTLAGDRYPTGPSEVSAFPIGRRAEVAATTGYVGIGLLAADLVGVEEELGLDRLHQVLEIGGLRHVELEVITGWYASGDRRRRSDVERASLLRAADVLGAHHVKVCGEFRAARGDIELMAEEFGKLCDEAARVGTTIAIEFIVASSIPDLATAREVIARAGRSNGKLCLDLWHVVRGDTALSEIATLPAEEIAHIELCDGRTELVVDLWTDTIHHRRLPGDGDFDVTGFLGAVRETGYRNTVGVEILSAEHRRLPLAEAATSAYTSTLRALELESTTT